MKPGDLVEWIDAQAATQHIGFVVGIPSGIEQKLTIWDSDHSFVSAVARWWKSRDVTIMNSLDQCSD